MCIYLLCNSCEVQYISSLPLFVVVRREKTTEEETGKTLASAPSTLLSGAALPDIEGLDLTFKPSMGEMSSLALPENLPLDFIASKIYYCRP